MQQCGHLTFDSIHVFLRLLLACLVTCDYQSLIFLISLSAILSNIRLQKSVSKSVFVFCDIVFHATESLLQAFLLLSETERDNRLLSQSLLDIAPNINKEQLMLGDVITKSPRVVCHLKRAQWEKVYFLVEHSLEFIICSTGWTIFT